MLCIIAMVTFPKHSYDCLILENLQRPTIVYMVEFRLLELAFHYDHDFAPLCFPTLCSTTPPVPQSALRYPVPPTPCPLLGSDSFLYSLISVKHKPSWTVRPAMSLSPQECGHLFSSPSPSCSFTPGICHILPCTKGSSVSSGMNTGFWIQDVGLDPSLATLEVVT